MYFLTRNDSYAEKLMREDISGRTRDTIIESMFIRGAFACCMRAIRTFGINKNTMEMLVAASICALSSELIRLLFDAGVTTSITFRPKGRRDGPSMRPIDVAASIRAEECLIVLCGQRDAMRAEHVPSLLMSVCTYSDGGALDAFAGSTSMSQAPLANQRAARCIAIALAAIQHPDEIAANQMHLDAALIATVQEIDTASVRQLLRFGANPARFMGESCSAAILACRVDNSEALFEMNQSHDIRSSISWRIQALIESARTASSECVRFLVSTETIDHSDIGDDELVQSSVGIE
jgi:hypothetical protein